jgi:hypothetical protein
MVDTVKTDIPPRPLASLGIVTDLRGFESADGP